MLDISIVISAMCPQRCDLHRGETLRGGAKFGPSAAPFHHDQSALFGGGRPGQIGSPPTDAEFHLSGMKTGEILREIQSEAPPPPSLGMQILIPPNS